MIDLGDRTAAWNALHSPETDAATLAAIAGAHPEFAPQVAAHPQAYPELRAWALALRAPDPSIPVAMVPPARASPVRSHRGWWIVTLCAFLIVSPLVWLLASVDSEILAGVGLDQRSFLWGAVDLVPYAFLVVCCLVAAPTPGRKAGSAVFAVLALGLALSSSPYLGWFAVIASNQVDVFVLLLVFFAWALARPLRGAAYAAVAVVAVLQVAWYLLWPAIAQAVYASGSWMLPILVFGLLSAVKIAVVVLCALAWSRVSERRAATRAQTSASMPGYLASGVRTTNVMAVLALVFAFVFSILGVVFGHIALTQIRRTGENGRGLAIAGLVVGYVWVAVTVAMIVFYLVALASLGASSHYYTYD